MFVFLQMSLGGGSVAVVQLPGGQFQVQGVIQSAQSSVIQSPQGQTVQVRPPSFLCTVIIYSFFKSSSYFLFKDGQYPIIYHCSYALC